MSAAPEVDLSNWTPAPCPPWCEHRDDVAHRRRGSDHERHYGAVPGSADPLVDLDSCYAVARVSVDLMLEDGDHDPAVLLLVHQPVQSCPDEGRWAEAAMTAREARKAAAMLLQAADRLDGADEDVQR